MTKIKRIEKLNAPEPFTLNPGKYQEFKWTWATVASVLFLFVGLLVEMTY